MISMKRLWFVVVLLLVLVGGGIMFSEYGTPVQVADSELEFTDVVITDEVPMLESGMSVNYFLKVGDVIENINDGDVNIVVDIVESFGGSVVYILDDGRRWGEGLIKRHWRMGDPKGEK